VRESCTYLSSSPFAPVSPTVRTIHVYYCGPPNDDAKFSQQTESGDLNRRAMLLSADFAIVEDFLCF